MILLFLFSTVRVWKSGCGSEVIEAHKPAVWAIAGLFAFDGTNRILTGIAKLGRKLFLIDITNFKIGSRCVNNAC